MDPSLYREIVEVVLNFKGLSRNCLKKLEELFPNISSDTLYSILSNLYQRKMKKNFGKTQNYRDKYWELFQEQRQSNNGPGIILKIAETFDIPPCLIARVILQKWYEDQEQNTTEREPVVNVNKYLRNTCFISDGDLAYEVFLCTIHDNLYSPLVDAMKASLGQQYEIRLHKEAVQLGLAFRNEDYLRKFGYDKTPDLKLEVPVAIEGFVINWIESKALFADEPVHREYVKNQYESYYNRFGPGLIIYWFGYLKTITEPVDKRFIIQDYLPSHVTKLCQVKVASDNIDLVHK